MTFIKITVLLVFSVLFLEVQAQVPMQRDGSGNITNLADIKTSQVVDEVRFEGVDNAAGRLKYSEIKGSPFWKDEWLTASLYSYSNHLLGTVKFKLNQATQELYYLDKNENELVTQASIKVVVHKAADTSSVLAIFSNFYPDLFINKQKVNGYLQELNQGDVKLLKLNTRVVRSEDSLFGTLKRYSFKTETYYFLYFNKKTGYIKKLTKENVLHFVPGAFTYKQWLEDNKINFKKEEDIIRFLDFYNEMSRKRPSHT